MISLIKMDRALSLLMFTKGSDNIPKHKNDNLILDEYNLNLQHCLLLKCIHFFITNSIISNKINEFKQFYQLYYSIPLPYMILIVQISLSHKDWFLLANRAHLD